MKAVNARNSHDDKGLFLIIPSILTLSDLMFVNATSGVLCIY
ncbi:hypothetical protein SAMN02746095_03546 [Acidocella aminolytica 101 = DSM 11237]|jgi:hypothetical protein|nr:hypothetical protein SAMN02746095_03546 [Acidocella aminolytica 101 = DSM 11237]